VGQQPVQMASLENQPMPAPIAAEPVAAPAPGSTWIVQIGAAPTEAGASTLLTGAASNLPALGAMKSYVERFEKSGQVFYRARFAGFDGRDDATAMCTELKKAKMSCLAMQS
jgi:D-alanyl-D-alanine carboxypeptidase